MDRYKAKAMCVFVLAIGCVMGESHYDSAEVPEEAFNTTTTDLGNEKQIKISSPNGTLLTTIAVFEIEGYEVDKPVDRNKCLVSKVSENATCYDEVPVADMDMIPDNIAAFCKGREVLSLVPTDCNKQAGATDVESDASDHGVVKRSVYYSTCGRWLMTYHRSCWEYCCNLWCWPRCKVCNTIRIWTYHTISGYERPF